VSYSDLFKINARRILAKTVKAFSVTSPDVSTHLRHGWISRRGWTFAETPLDAISSSTWNRRVNLKW